jgi:hypothetical protein
MCNTWIPDGLDCGISLDAVSLGLVGKYQIIWSHILDATHSLIKHVYFDQEMLETIHITFYKQIPMTHSWSIYSELLFSVHFSVFYSIST